MRKKRKFIQCNILFQTQHPSTARYYVTALIPNTSFLPRAVLITLSTTLMSVGLQSRVTLIEMQRAHFLTQAAPGEVLFKTASCQEETGT